MLPQSSIAEKGNQLTIPLTKRFGVSNIRARNPNSERYQSQRIFVISHPPQ